MRLLPGIMHTALTWQSVGQHKSGMKLRGDSQVCKVGEDAKLAMQTIDCMTAGWLSRECESSGFHSCNATTP